jgi:beta-glucosidase/6-phospho-beta-glucosidase/beta-galactosidase
MTDYKLEAFRKVVDNLLASNFESFVTTHFCKGLWIFKDHVFDNQHTIERNSYEK